MTARCDSCASVMINGLFCHETGCPKNRKPRTCRECGNPDPDGTCCAPAEDETTGCDECDANGLTHVDYPHEPGYLFDCEACEDHCHCSDASGKRTEGLAACVFSECSDEDDEDEDHEEHDTDGPDDGCSVCESMGACPSCHSLSPGRCGCNNDESEDAE